MTNLPYRRCETCVSWSNTEAAVATATRRPKGLDVGLGICRFYPPVIVSGAGTRFPEIHAHRTCDHWVLNEPDVPEDDETVVPFGRAAA